MAILYKTCVVIIILCLPMVAARAEDGDDTLRYYLSMSPLVVSGEIVQGPACASTELGVCEYDFSVKVAKTLKGGARDEINVCLSRPQDVESETLAFMKKHSRVILFLKEARDFKTTRGWKQADPWFSAQPASELLERSLARLAHFPASEKVGENGDDTLRYYKSRASLVVSGEVREISPATYADDSTCTRSMRVKVGRIMRGGVQGDEITASVTRLEDKAQAPAFLAKGKRVILFLRERNTDPQYETVDPWFGIQQGNSNMEASLDELYAE
ncbi:MAG TPA: hypothetical protein VMV10_20900 [Pirellulales bacterium]|nr:hypothetical protein [Pirellulales bacterium]